MAASIQSIRRRNQSRRIIKRFPPPPPQAAAWALNCLESPPLSSYLSAVESPRKQIILPGTIRPFEVNQTFTATTKD